MRGERTRDMVRREYVRIVARAVGKPSSLQGMAGSRMADTIFDNIGMLPTTEEEVEIQTSAGDFKFLLGYSAFGGGDVIG